MRPTSSANTQVKGLSVVDAMVSILPRSDFPQDSRRVPLHLWKLNRQSRGDDGAALLDALRSVRDGLRAHLSLSQAVVRAGAVDGSPLGPLIPELGAGRPLADVLEEGAARADGPDLSFSLLVLSVQARTGGDPTPAVTSLEARMRRQLATARELRSLTTQARLSARVMLLLTPGFLLLLTALDPAGMAQAVTSSTVWAIVAGLGLQGLGGVWMSRIVAAPLRVRARRASALARLPVLRSASGLARLPVLRAASGLARLPVLRAAAALSGGRNTRSTGSALDVAHACELMAMTLDAGLAPPRALELVAPVTPGHLGDALREAVAGIRAGASRSRALEATVGTLDDPAAGRLVEAMRTAGDLGVPIADTLRAIAEQVREDHAAATVEQVRVASVKVLLPLGMLILPAFVLACIVPLFLTGLRGVAL